MVRHRLSDDEWDLISDLFPPPSNIGRPRNNPRDMMDGILWILRTGRRGTTFRPRSAIGRRFGMLSIVGIRDGTLSRILSRLMASHVDVGLIDQELWLIDGDCCARARCAAGGGKESDPDEPDDHALGRSRGGFSTKVHLLCDRHGHPLAARLTPGQEHESRSLCELLDSVDVADHDGALIPLPEKLAGDKAYRAEWIDECLLNQGIAPVIPSKTNEDRDARAIDFDKDSYRARNIVERLIGWLKESRRVLTRFEKTAKNYLGMLRVAFIHRYLRLTCV